MKRRWILILVMLVTALLFIVCVNFALNNRVKSFYYNSRSMEPTIPYGSKVIWESFGIDSITRGDLVVYLPRSDSPSATREAYVSRVIAIPGDTVAVGNDLVIINNIIYKGGDLIKIKNYPVPGYNFSGDIAIPGEFKVMGNNEFFVISDNWSNAVDSRVFGGINIKQIVGKVIIR